MSRRPDLPLAGDPPPRERADAARNRARVLAAAEKLFAERDPLTVTMDDIAKAAGIGRGTLYRRYPDRASIARALLGEHERALQERLMRGPAPLGPGDGATPAERLAAFYEAMLDLLQTHVNVLCAEASARYATGAYAFWRLHVRHLAHEAGVEDADTIADLLLAPLAPDLYRDQRERGVSDERIRAGLTALAYRTLSPRQ